MNIVNRVFILLLFVIYYILINRSKEIVKDCISLIVPSTEKDFFKCYKQFFYSINSYKQAKEIVIAISSVTNISKIKQIINSLVISRKIILGLRNSKENTASNRNYGFELSSCSIISYIDMDDIMSGNRLSILYNYFKKDKYTEFLIHKFTTNCNRINNKNPMNPLEYKYNLSFSYIYLSYKLNSVLDKPNLRFCCKYISPIKNEYIHNGWPTMRRYIMKKIKYNESYAHGQDSDFNANVILSGFNTSILNIALGYYVKDNICLNYKRCRIM